MSITELDLAPIEARADAATDGPWTWDGHDLNGWSGDDHYRFEEGVLVITHDGGCCCRAACHLEVDLRPQDAAFIASSRTDMARLLGEVRRLRAAVAAAELRHREHDCGSGADGCDVYSGRVDGRYLSLCSRDGKCQGCGEPWPCPDHLDLHPQEGQR